MIYFVQYGRTPYVKIGYTGQDDLLKRISSLQTATPEPLKILAVLDGTTAEEGALHARFSEHEVLEDREWFWIRGDLKDFLAGVPPYQGRQLSDCVRRTRARREVEPADPRKYLRSMLPEIEATLHEVARDQTASEGFRCEVARMLTHIACVKYNERMRASRVLWQFYNMGVEAGQLPEGLLRETAARLRELPPETVREIREQTDRAFETAILC